HSFSKTPLPADEDITSNDGHATAQDIHTYQSIIGSVNFAAISTRPDVAFAMTKLSEFLQNPSGRHIYLAKRVLSYLGGTKQLSLCYTGFMQDQTNLFTISSDASYANDIETRRSHQGTVMALFGAAVDWKASKQPTVTTSTTEAELLALSEAAKQCFWWKRFFQAIQFNPGHPIDIQCDNKQTLRLMEENVSKLSTKLRHVDIHNHWLRQETQAGKIHLRWTPTAQMIADGLTKPLYRQKHTTFVEQMGLQPLLN
ncbi:Reverse transcriptase RNA-dependent DNA polymerase, partial [Neofusicoccum parvum]